MIDVRALPVQPRDDCDEQTEETVALLVSVEGWADFGDRSPLAEQRRDQQLAWRVVQDDGLLVRSSRIQASSTSRHRDSASPARSAAALSSAKFSNSWVSRNPACGEPTLMKKRVGNLAGPDYVEGVDDIVEHDIRGSSPQLLVADLACVVEAARVQEAAVLECSLSVNAGDVLAHVAGERFGEILKRDPLVADLPDLEQRLGKRELVRRYVAAKQHHASPMSGNWPLYLYLVRSGPCSTRAASAKLLHSGRASARCAERLLGRWWF